MHMEKINIEIQVCRVQGIWRFLRKDAVDFWKEGYSELEAGHDRAGSHTYGEAAGPGL